MTRDMSNLLFSQEASPDQDDIPTRLAAVDPRSGQIINNAPAEETRLARICRPGPEKDKSISRAEFVSRSAKATPDAATSLWVAKNDWPAFAWLGRLAHSGLSLRTMLLLATALLAIAGAAAAQAFRQEPLPAPVQAEKNSPATRTASNEQSPGGGQSPLPSKSVSKEPELQPGPRPVEKEDPKQASPTVPQRRLMPAAEALIEGRFDDALRNYQALAAALPNEESHALVVEILLRQRERNKR